MIAKHSEKLAGPSFAEANDNFDVASEMQTEDVLDCVRVYAKKHPEKFALWCFGIGFVLGWRLKPW